MRLSLSLQGQVSFVDMECTDGVRVRANDVRVPLGCGVIILSLLFFDYHGPGCFGRCSVRRLSLQSPRTSKMLQLRAHNYLVGPIPFPIARFCHEFMATSFEWTLP